MINSFSNLWSADALFFHSFSLFTLLSETYGI